MTRDMMNLMCRLFGHLMRITSPILQEMDTGVQTEECRRCDHRIDTNLEISPDWSAWMDERSHIKPNEN